MRAPFLEGPDASIFKAFQVMSLTDCCVSDRMRWFRSRQLSNRSQVSYGSLSLIREILQLRFTEYRTCLLHDLRISANSSFAKKVSQCGLHFEP